MNQAKPRVMFVGGEDVHLRIPTIIELQKRGYELAVAAPVDCPGIRDVGCTMFHYDLNRGITPRRDILAMRQLLAASRQWQPDVIHAFDTKPNFLMPLAFRHENGVAVVRTITGMGKIFSMNGGFYSALRKVYNQAHRMARRRTDYSIFQNADDYRYFLETGLVTREKSEIIAGSGIDVAKLQTHSAPEKRAALRSELGLSQGDVAFAMITRVIPQKGVAEYFAAARKVRAAHPEACFFLVGPGPGEEPGAVSLAEIEAAADAVTYLGRRSDIPRLLDAIDVFVLPTKYREGVPRAMLEAMAMERPVVVSDMPGCRDALMQGDVGYLVAPGNSDSLAAATARMMQADRAAMGMRARELVQTTYSLEKVVDALERIYSRLMTRRLEGMNARSWKKSWL